MNKIKEITQDWKWPDYSIMLLILVFAAFNKSMPAAMIIAGLSLILVRNDWSEIKRLLNPKYPFIWFIIFFLVHIVGLINTENVEFGTADIGMKASLIAIPVFLVCTKLTLKLYHIVSAILIALFIACLINYSYAIFRSIYNAEDNQWAYFTESYFSYNMHRSYFATYLAIGTLISVYRLFDQAKNRPLYILLSIVFAISTFLTFSKAGILILFVLMIPLSFYLIKKYYGRLYAFIGIGSLVILMGVGVASSQTLSNRFSTMVSGLVNNQTEKNTSQESSAARMIMWSTSMELLSENTLVGVGTGDVRDELDKRNLQLGNLGVVEHSLNSHNQYLNTGVQLGLMGMIPLIMSMLTALILSIKKRNLIFFLMVVCFILTMLFESFLETQAGLIPVTLFTLLYALKLLNLSPKSESNLEAVKFL